MQTWSVLSLTVCFFCSSSQAASAKHVLRDGSESRFWKTHVLVFGNVDHVEQPGDSRIRIDFRVSDCVPPHFAAGERVEAIYNLPDKSAVLKDRNLVEGLKPGDPVLVLLRPAFGFPNLPNGVGESFAMMPDGAALYRPKDSNDPALLDTLRIVKACSVDDLSVRISAIDEARRACQTDRGKQFCVTYLNSLIRQTEADLQNARAALKAATDAANK